MKKVVHIIPVGHTKVTLIEGMKQYPFHKLILILGKQKSSGEAKARKIADEIKKEFTGIAIVKYHYVDIDDIYQTAIEIAKVVVEEQKEQNEVKINASGSLRTIGISCYLASSLTGAELYVSLPSYEDGNVAGIKKVVEIPAFPVKEIGSEELKILKFLHKKGPVESLDSLIEGINLGNISKNTHLKERARMSYHIKKLKKDGFIKTHRLGKNLKIEISRLGELYNISRFT